MAFSRLITKLNKQPPQDIHDQITKITYGLIPSRDQFPYQNLKQLAEKFVSRNKGLDPVSLENILLGVIRNHDRLEVALAAFVPCLNTQPIQHALNEQVFKWQRGELTLENLIEILTVLNHWRPDIVPYTEIFNASGLMRLQATIGADPSMGPRAVKDFFASTQIPSNIAVSSIIRWLAESQFDWLARTLDVYAANMDWAKAHNLVNWMIDIRQVLPHHLSAGHICLRSIIDEKFPNWAYWTNWRPNPKRIQGMSRWREDDRINFREILQLEGPCFTDHTKSCQRQTVVDCVTEQAMLGLGSVVMLFSSNDKMNVEKTLNLLIDVICRTAEESGERYTEMIRLVRQGTHSRLLTERKINAISECINNAKTLEFISAVNRVLFPVNPGAEIPIDTLTLLLNELGQHHYKDLADEVGPTMYTALSEQLQERQEFVRVPTEPPTKWMGSDWSNLDKLQKFGITLRWSRFADTTNTSVEAQAVRQWPERAEFDQWRVILKIIHANEDNLQAASLIQKYVRHRFIISEPMIDSDRELAEHFIRLWVPESPRRKLLLIISELTFPITNNFNIPKIEYLLALSKLDDELVSRLVGSFIDDCFGDWLSIYFLINSLATHEEQIIKQWKFALLWHIELRKGQDIVEWALKSLSLDSWFQFGESISKVFPEITSGKTKKQDLLFSSSLLAWSQTIKPYKNVLVKLEEEGERFNHVSESFLKGSEDLEQAADLEQMLKIFSTHLSDVKLGLLLEVVSFLDQTSGNADLVVRAMEAVVQVTKQSLWVCESILHAYHTLSIEVVETIVVYSLRSSDIKNVDQRAIEAVAELIATENERDFEAMLTLSDPANIQTTDAYFREEMQSLVQEAFRLERLRRTMSAQDRIATKQLIKDLDIEDSGALRSAIENLPAELINSVELVSETVFEIQIQIEKIKPLARRAIGANTATSLIVRFSGYLSNSPLKFCIHFNTDVRPIGIKSHAQTPALQNASGVIVPCYSRMSPMIHQLSSRLQKFFNNKCNDDGMPSIKVIHDFIVGEIESLGSSCTVCGAKHQTGISVSLPSSSSTSRKEIRRVLSSCPSLACRTAFSNYPIDVRLATLHEDPETFDVLLQGISAIVHADMFDSLPDPRPKIDVKTIKQILLLIPNMTKLQDSKDLTSFLSFVDNHLSLTAGTTATFMTWVATSYAGFLTRATDSLKLPSLPDSHQFLLAETDTKREADFAAHVAKMPSGESTQIMFHATSMARLPLILSQGLRCMSGTNLQAHGSSFGKGIYLTPEPSTAWPYATSQPASQSWANSQFRFGGYGVILACELAGKWSPVATNKHIYVVTDPSCVIVRFVILLPKKNRVPIAGHLVPAITSVCSGLRSGAL